ncbi:hypothetical protein Tco_0977076 [Tanacetum coccineum]|uniref:Uncharacterized protein n=1 Tax=Tanacetum coccineum TaxID=301880 RepID=A0ABQ5EJ51_9ASTR
MEVIPDEEEIAVDAIPLATKPSSIVDYKIIKEEKISYYQIIRADGSSKRYSAFIQMLRSFDREDLETLWKLVKAKHGYTRPEEGYERVLWGDLKTMFEHHVEDLVWRNLQGNKVLVWKLFDSCGVHFVRFQSLHVFMLVEKRYPLTPATITEMLNKKLQADHWNEMIQDPLKWDQQNETLKRHYKELSDSIKTTKAKTIEHTTSLIAKNTEFKAQLQEKGFAIAALKNELRKLTRNSVNTKFARTSILRKPVLQPHRNQSVVRQPTAFKSERPRISKQRFASQVDVNNDLSKPVTTHYLPKEKESAVVKPHHMIAPNSSRSTKPLTHGMPRWPSVCSHFDPTDKKEHQMIARIEGPRFRDQGGAFAEF